MSRPLASLLPVALVVLASFGSAAAQEPERTLDREGMVHLLQALELVAECDGLWPRRPEMVKRYEEWLASTESLLARRAAYERLADGQPRLRRLLDAFDDLAARVPDIEARREFAGSVVASSLADHEDAWSEVLDELFLDERFEELEMEPQVGLVPLGPDPDSGLWEFWHVGSGARPQRDTRTGRWKLTAETGLVFVLVPGGTFTMGAESPDANHLEGAPHVDPLSLYFFRPAHEVTLDAYFLSKYEMNQAQWQRIAGANPSQTRPVPPLEFSIVKPTNPVETVSHSECERMLARLGLVLPTEAQWERACRAGTVSVFSTGAETLTLHGFANVMDSSHPDRSKHKTGFDDGFVDHAPVGSFRPNAYGLHDMHGNLAEWCREPRHHYSSVAAQAGDGERRPDAGHQCSGDKLRVIRGGSFWDAAERATSAERWGSDPRARSWSVGVRPARSVKSP